MTLEALYRNTLTALTSALGPAEGKATARLVIEDAACFPMAKVLSSPELEVEPETVMRVYRVVKRIAGGEPPQYAVGRARFMGMDLSVTSDTLIPRPETAGLVDLITDDMAGRSDLRVLDAGTGSGCIAIALSRALPFARVEAIDISDGALLVARGNARALHADVDFSRADMLALAAPAEPLYDIIVSNPPYIAEGEADTVDGSVAAYEPHSALFVPDDDPLRFYHALADYGRSALRPGGRLYFEINPNYADRLAADLAAGSYRDIEILLDAYGRRRYARASLC
ncbi:MAG: peptide chain release factor N(5)-glutamine methyltransferase [Bacteroides sp.]|nr:peptide chain release factor N(5)-glutamine methyltransferase [Bacteroides sp.]MCM1095493.1 peptide chain release factor N(5)-glutamine methyltransferase [Terasakiella sp.]